MKKKYPENRPVRISDRITGVEYLSAPMPVHAPRGSGSTSPLKPEAQQAELPSEPRNTDNPEATEYVKPVPGDSSAVGPRPESEATAGDSLAGPQEENASVHAREGEESTKSKSKPEIENLEQFLAYAFGRKGQRVVLKPKVEKLIAPSPRLDEAARDRLFALADADALLAVPRELLLVSREVSGLPALRAAINEFALDVMLRHPIFSDADLQASLRNLPDAMSTGETLKRIIAFSPAPIEGQGALKPAELQTLKLNAVQLVIAWLATTRSVSIEELSQLLFQFVWAPAARELTDDNARLRALTEIEHAPGVGLACEKFRQRAVEAHTAQDQALREVVGLREKAAFLASQLEQSELKAHALEAELQALKASAAAELAETKRLQVEVQTHLRHDLEQLRGRLVRRLGDSVEMLEVGLSALRNKTPRTEVMAERAEHVIDALRAEENYLKEE